MSKRKLNIDPFSKFLLTMRTVPTMTPGIGTPTRLRWKRLKSFWERQTGAASVTSIVKLHLHKRTRAAFLVFCNVCGITSSSLTPWLLNGLVNFKLWVIRVPLAEQVIGLLKSDLPTSGSLGDNNLPGNTPTVWAFWDWLCRTVMSPLAVLAVQPSLFPYFHVRNNEIYSLTHSAAQKRPKNQLWG